MILAIDPGKDKCGLAVLDAKREVLERKVLERLQLSSEVLRLISKYGASTVVIGRSVFGKDVEIELLRLNLKANLVFIAEKDTTRQARERYWKENRPSGWLRLIPTSLRVPPVPVDDYAAIIIGERYLQSH